MNSEPTVWQLAHAYHRAGLSVIPVRTDGSKSPALAHQHPILSRRRRPTLEELAHWFQRAPQKAIAIQAGPPSGQAECLDFEDPDVYAAWETVVRDHWPAILDQLCLVKTPRPGIHVWYRLDGEVPGSKKLARRADGQVIIETRGAGSYALAPSGPVIAHSTRRPYLWLGPRPLTDLATLDRDQRDSLIDVACSLNQYGGQLLRERHHHPAHPNTTLTTYDLTASWESILGPHGWECVREQNGVRYWRRPGKDGAGWSATTGYCRSEDGTDLLYVFSSNAGPLQDGHSYSKFRAFTALNHHGDQRLASRHLAQRGVPLTPDQEQNNPLTETLTEDDVTPVEWLWRGWLPCGKLTMLDGDPGLGKSTLLADLIGRVTSGSDFFGERRPREPGSVLLLSSEDDAADTILPRLLAAGADLSRVHLLRPSWRNAAGRPFCIPDDLPYLENLAQRLQPKLIAIDPIVAYFAAWVSCFNDASVRQALLPLQELAARHRCAVIMVRHLNKSGQTKALYRGGGSIGFNGAARTVMLVTKHPEEEDQRILSWVKGNLAPPQVGLAYRLEVVPTQGCCRVTWMGAVEFAPDELVGK